MEKKPKFKVGGIVRVKKGDKHKKLTEDLCGWNSLMDETVGKEGKIMYINGIRIGVNFKSPIDNTWEYHEDSLVKVDKKKGIKNAKRKSNS